MLRRIMLVSSLLLATVPRAHAQGLWTTYLRPFVCNDLIALSDTVWLATAEAGLVRYYRSSGTWDAITREPSGLAGNFIQAIAFDRSGNLYAAVPGKGLSRLDRDGRWSLINAFDGLPSDSVLAIRPQGDTLWIGTTRGLALWDGRQIAGSVPDLGTLSPFSHNAITGVAVTGDSLFVSTPEGAYFARISQRLRPWTQINTGLPLTPNVLHMASDGRVVLVVARGPNPSNPAQELFSSWGWNPLSGSWQVDRPAGGASVRRVRDDAGAILCTTTGGVFRRRAPGDWASMPGSPATDNLDKAAVEPTTDSSDSSGAVFAFTGGFLLEKASPAWTALRSPGPLANNARNIAWDRGTVYVNYTNNGVSRLRGGEWRNYPSAPVNCENCDTTFFNTINATSLLVDPLGYRWIGMWGGALTRFTDEVSPPQFKNIFYVSGSADSVHLHSCTHAAEVDLTPGQFGGRWFGLDSDRIGDANGNPLGIDVYDTAGAFVRNYGPGYPGLRNGLVRALAVDRTNQMWVGYKGSGMSTFQVPDSLKAIALQDVDPPPDGTNLDVFGLTTYGDSVWVLAADGLHRYRRGGSYASKLSIAAPPALFSVHPLAVTPDGTVYVGTVGGMRMHRRGQFPVDFTASNSPLANNEVRSIYAEPTGAVWIATAGGIHRFDPDYVPPVPPSLPSLTVKLYPNPAWLTGAGIELRMSGQATAYDGEVYDLNGRLVHRFHVAGNGLVVWNGRDLDQRWVGPGVYFLKVRGGGAEATSRIVVLH